MPLFRRGDSCLASPVDDDDGECDGLPLGALGGGGETRPSTKTATQMMETVTI